MQIRALLFPGLIDDFRNIRNSEGFIRCNIRNSEGFIRCNIRNSEAAHLFYLSIKLIFIFQCSSYQ